MKIKAINAFLIFFTFLSAQIRISGTVIDSKTTLQEYSLKKFKLLPKYKLQKISGPHHNPNFKATVQIKTSKKYIGFGNSKKIAQQNAAKNLLYDMKII